MGSSGGRREKHPAYTPAIVGALYNGNGQTGTTTRTTGTALNQLVAGGPLYSGAVGLSMDLFDLNVVTQGTAGAIYRAGVWVIDDQENPFRWVAAAQYATLLAEVLQGGLPFDVTTIGAKTRTPAAPIVVPPETWFVVGGVSQVAVCQPTIGMAAARFSPHGALAGTTGLVGVETWVKQMNVSGALGNLVADAVQANIGHGVGFRRSA